MDDVKVRWWQWVVTAVVIGWLVAMLSLVASAEPPSLLGVYPAGHCSDAALTYLPQIDRWLAPTGKRVTFCGEFMSPEFVYYYIEDTMHQTWSLGYIPFVNLLENYTLASINAGTHDSKFTEWAKRLNIFLSQGGGRRVFIAPLPEGNGSWVGYYTPGANAAAYQAAWLRIKGLVNAQVPPDTVRWVFAPNGWDAGKDAFELYYPGHAEVDVVGLSVFHTRGCGGATETYAQAVGRYVTRARLMAPGKPIVLAQTGAVTAFGFNKDVWLRDLIVNATQEPSLRALIFYSRINVQGYFHPYFRRWRDCDFRMHNPSTGQWAGVKDGVTLSAAKLDYGRASSALLDMIFATQPERLYSDVTPFHPWAEDDAYGPNYEPGIRALTLAGVDSGCGSGQFCPNAHVLRDLLAVWVLRAVHGGGYTPPAATGTVFADVPSTHPLAAWIERFAAERYTAGCAANPPRYCPSGSVSRGEAAVFMLRAKHGTTFVPPPATGTRFTDVPATHGLAAWIERAAVEGLIAGCTATQFCPSGVSTRAALAGFLATARGL